VFIVEPLIQSAPHKKVYAYRFRFQEGIGQSPAAAAITSEDFDEIRGLGTEGNVIAALSLYDLPDQEKLVKRMICRSLGYRISRVRLQLWSVNLFGKIATSAACMNFELLIRAPSIVR
jgi:hypothetical protein|tara:strand:- start:3263 stop:3616 length:354 start_codon:yes stop_codon:yes gene_type:complete